FFARVVEIEMRMMVDAGVRAELLLSRLDGYEQLEDEDDDDAEGEEEKKGTETESQAATQAKDTEQINDAAPPPTDDVETVSQEKYLHSNLTLQPDRLLDADKNGVMMAWETDIMRRSAEALLPQPGLRVLNIGHGMGIVDGLFQARAPAAHHIVEAHPDVLAAMEAKGWRAKPGVTVHAGRWQDVLPRLVEQGETFDAIYYDTFAESYDAFRAFFAEHVISLLDADGRWGFFNGMGADRQISYDVYQKVVEMDLLEAGFDVDWLDVPVPPLEDEWEGVRRKYWVVKDYRLPVCRYMD
ncbi:Arginine N-methyltransferase 2, partial [Ascosphaera acerosa]